MGRSNKVEGTKIAQAAKDLNVTSVTIRRYLSEFDIDTIPDENGIKVLPDQAMEELKTIRRLKEEGYTNPQVMEYLEGERAKGETKSKAKGRAAKAEEKEAPAPKKEAKKESKRESRKEEPADDEDEAPAAPEKKRATRHERKVVEEVEADEEPVNDEAPEAVAQESVEELPSEGKSKHSLTCQTCGKTFEHMNPRLRDCLDCYRTKRKERRRGGADRHKNVIQHPLAQQVANKAAQQQSNQHSVQEDMSPPPAERPERIARPERRPVAAASPVVTLPNASLARPVRNYRKAIEETRLITGSLKRRLERPDLPEGERRWLEQIYAYQLILHQGWRHLSEYKQNTQQQGRGED